VAESPGVKTPLSPAAAAVALVAAACYLNTFGNQFAFDDLEVIVRNPLVSGGGAGRAASAFSSHYWAHVRESGSLYRPVTILSYAANHAVSGLAPWSYHLVNVALHALVSAFVTLLGARLRLGTPAALAAGLIFAVHPVHTEAVAGVVGRAELLAAAGVLGAWLVHLGGTGLPRAAAVGVLFGAGLFSKENAVVLPALMLCGDAWRMRAGKGPRPRDLAATYAACALVLAAWGLLRAGALPPGDPASDSPLAGEPATVRVLTALHVLARYAGLLLAPVTLSADYSFNQIPVVRSASDPLAITGAVLLAALVALAAGLRRGRVSGLLAAAGLASFLPVSNLLLPIGTLMAERLMYLPSVFVCLGVPAIWRRAADAVAGNGSRHGHVRRRLAAAALALVVLAGAGRTLARNADWRDQLTLFSATVRSSPRSARAHYNLGVALEEAKRPTEALARYQEALAIDPADHRAHHNAGLLLAAAGRPEEAARHLDLALRMNPSLKDAAASLGAVYAGLGRARDAEQVMRAAIPGATGETLRRLQYNLGTVLLDQGRTAEAIERLERARDSGPDDADGRYQLGLAYLRAGRWEESRDEMRRARALSPELAEASVMEALACWRLGDRAGAADAAARARAAGLALPVEIQSLAP
jgi:tetratricopeptide (TPR) repeat protein